MPDRALEILVGKRPRELGEIERTDSEVRNEALSRFGRWQSVQP
jgi:hypothetical protein